MELELNSNKWGKGGPKAKDNPYNNHPKLRFVIGKYLHSQTESNNINSNEAESRDEKHDGQVEKTVVDAADKQRY